MAIITATILSEMLSPEELLRLFDPAGSGSVNASHRDRCIAVAESEVRMILGTHLSAQVDSNGTPDPAVVEHCARICLYHAASRHVGIGGSSRSLPLPYRQGYEDALAFFKKVANDDRRTVTNDLGQAEPKTRTNGLTDANGDATQVWTRAANKADSSLF